MPVTDDALIRELTDIAEHLDPARLAALLNEAQQLLNAQIDN